MFRRTSSFGALHTGFCRNLSSLISATQSTHTQEDPNFVFFYEGLVIVPLHVKPCEGTVLTRASRFRDVVLDPCYMIPVGAAVEQRYYRERRRSRRPSTPSLCQVVTPGSGEEEDSVDAEHAEDA